MTRDWRFLGVLAEIGPIGKCHLPYRESRPENHAGFVVNSGFRSRLHHRFALIFQGEAMVKAGGDNPPVEPEPSLPLFLHPQILRKSPFLHQAGRGHSAHVNPTAIKQQFPLVNG